MTSTSNSERSDGHDELYIQRLRDLTPDEFRRDTFPPDPRGVYSRPPCRVSSCERSVQGVRPLCRLHYADYVESGIADLADFIPAARETRLVRNRAHGGQSSRGIIDISGHPSPTLRAEVALVMSCKATGEFGGRFAVNALNAFIQILKLTSTDSLMQLRDETRVRDILSHAGGHRPTFEMYIRDFPQWIERALDVSGLRKPIGKRRGGSTRWSSAQDIEQTWLREYVERWVSFRVRTEAGSPEYIGAQERAIVRFSEWLAKKKVSRLEDLQRDHLIAWLGEVNSWKKPDGQKLSGSYRRHIVSAVPEFLQFARRELKIQIPLEVEYLPRERPKADPPNPRFLEPRVIETLREPASLAKIKDPSHRVAVTIMMHVGLRAGHTCSLPFDCLLDLNRGGTTDKWGLSFVDTKADKRINVPIVPEVAQAIREQQVRAKELTAQMPPGTFLRLFPNPRASKTGQLAPERLNEVLTAWIAELDLREPDGSLVHVTPHRFRHTFATEMLNKRVPIEIVRDLLGHGSVAATEVYANSSDARVRAEWEKAIFTNVDGEVLRLPDGDAADAEWLSHKLSRAIQPLPNGACGLPIQHTCPHANACLDCRHFLTTPEFLPIHHAQSADFDRIISKAERDGHFRIVEINKRSNDNLKKIIATLESQVG